MDSKQVMDGSGGAWTEERHTSFLNQMEESFVKRMLGFGGGDRGSVMCADRRRRPRLDRYLPDSATESTRDVKDAVSRSDRNPRTTRSATEDPEAEEDLGMISHDTTRKRPLPRYDASQDQVVPEVGSTEADGGDNNNNKKKKRGEPEVLLFRPLITGS